MCYANVFLTFPPLLDQIFNIYILNRAPGDFSGYEEVVLEEHFSPEAYMMFVRYIYGDKVGFKSQLILHEKIWQNICLNIKMTSKGQQLVLGFSSRYPCKNFACSVKISFVL